MNFRCFYIDNLDSVEKLQNEIHQLTGWLYILMSEVERCQNISMKRLPDDLKSWWQYIKDIEDQKRKDAEEQSKRDAVILQNALSRMSDYELQLVIKHFQGD